MQAHDGPKRSYRHDRQQQQPEPEVSSRVTSCAGFVLQTKLVPARATIWLWVLWCACSFAVAPARAGPRYSSRIVDTKSGAIRGVILELNSKHLEPVEVNWIYGARFVFDQCSVPRPRASVCVCVGTVLSESSVLQSVAVRCEMVSVCAAFFFPSFFTNRFLKQCRTQPLR